MFNGKMKAITFSFDDGVEQDKRLVRIFNKYGLKCTFNINSEFLGKSGELIRSGKTVGHNKILPSEVAEVYAGHEVAVHTLTHPHLPPLPDDEVIRQVEEDRKNLSALCGYEVIGMAYPGGGVNNDDRVAEIIKANTGVRYARTIKSTYSFDRQDYLYRFNPTVSILETEKMYELADRFLAMDPTTPQLFYIWGHAYEFDIDDTWDAFDEFCRRISGRDDVFYGTNKEVLL